MNQASSRRAPKSARMVCLCAPTTHVGSFRCRLHRATQSASAEIKLSRPPRVPRILLRPSVQEEPAAITSNSAATINFHCSEPMPRRISSAARSPEIVVSQSGELRTLLERFRQKNSGRRRSSQRLCKQGAGPSRLSRMVIACGDDFC